MLELAHWHECPRCVVAWWCDSLPDCDGALQILCENCVNETTEEDIDSGT